MATTTLTVDDNLETHFWLDPTGDQATGSWATAPLWSKVDDGATPDDDTTTISTATAAAACQFTTDVDSNLGTGEKIYRVGTELRYKVTGRVDDSTSLTPTVVGDGSQTLTGTSSFTAQSSTWADLAATLQQALVPAGIATGSVAQPRCVFNRANSMGADALSMLVTRVRVGCVKSPVPKEMGTYLDAAGSGGSFSPTWNFSLLTTDDNFTISSNILPSASKFQGYGLSNTPADFNDAVSLVMNVRAWAAVASVCFVGIVVRSSDMTGTVLAAATSTPSSEYTSALTTSEALYNVTCSYINTGATKTQWDNAVAIFEFANNDASTRQVQVDFVDFTLTYNTSGPTASYIIPRKDRLMGTYLQL